MKTIGLLLLLTLSNLLVGQITECYCFENEEGSYTEWLVFAQRGLKCENPPRISKMFDEDKKGIKFPYIEEGDQILFVKKVDFSVDLPVGISSVGAVQHYYYSRTRIKDGLQVHIEYKPSFQDMMGPPDRLYKKVELKE